MIDIVFILLLISLAAWLYLALLHHGFWLRREFLSPATPMPKNGHTDQNSSRVPKVVTLIPARNEAGIIAQALKAHIEQDYGQIYQDKTQTQTQAQTLLIDDNSMDGTYSIAQNIIDGAHAHNRISILRSAPLEEGWSGKLWALHNGFNAINNRDEIEYYWLSDADIVPAFDTLSKLVQKAEQDGLALVSLMVQLHCQNFWERLIIPAFIYYFQMLYPFKACANPKSKIAGAAGGCVLIRRDALESIGGIAAIKDALIDDCALAAAVKAKGYKIWLGHGPQNRSIRPANRLKDLWHMVTRTAFTQLQFSYLYLALAIIGMIMLYSLPLLGIFIGLYSKNIAVLGLACLIWAIMTMSYYPTIRAYEQSPLMCLTLPFTAHIFMAMTLHSAYLYAKGQRSSWHGRIYSKHSL